MMVQFTLRRGRTPVRFPNQIRTYRLRAHVSQRQLAELVGSRRSEVSAWERGWIQPNLQHAFQLARALDTLVENLFWSLYRPGQGKGPPPHGKHA